MLEWMAANEWSALAAVAVVGAIFAIGMWVGAVNADRKTFNIFMKKVDDRFDRIMEKIDNSFDRITEKIDNNFDRITERVDNSFDRIMERVDSKLDRILERLPAAGAVRPDSPIRLTDFGRKISATGSANAWARDHAPDLEADAAGQEEFEIFDLCVGYIAERFENEAGFRRTVRATAYEHGTEVEQVLKVYQVELRDRLLASLAGN